MKNAMKAAVLTQYGGPESIQIKEVAKPIAADHEILVRVHASAINSADVRLRKADPFVIRFMLGLFGPKDAILGMDFSGVVESVGKSVTRFNPGDEVLGSTVDSGMKAHAEYLTIAEEGLVLPKPHSLSHEEAPSFYFGGSAALHFLRKGEMKAGDKLLVYGASGALGVYAVQLGKYFGAEVTTVSSERNISMLRELGADHTLDYTKGEYASNQDKYDVIFDTIGLSPFGKSVQLLKKDGKYLRAVHLSPGVMLRGLWVNLTSSKKVIGGVAGDGKGDFQYLTHLIEERHLKPVVDQTFSLENIQEAHAYVGKGHKRGSVIIKVK